MYIVGIDIAKRKHEAAVIDGDGAVVIKPFSFTNNCSGYNRLLAMPVEVEMWTMDTVKAVSWLSVLFCTIWGNCSLRTKASDMGIQIRGDISLHLLHNAAFQRGPVQRSAAFQQNAVDLFLPQPLHELPEIHMAVFLIHAEHLAPSLPVNRLSFRVGAAGGEDGRNLVCGGDHLRLRRPQMGVADDANGVSPVFHAAGQEGIVCQNGAHAHHDAPKPVPLLLDMAPGRLSRDPLGNPSLTASISRTEPTFWTSGDLCRKRNSA